MPTLSELLDEATGRIDPTFDAGVIRERVIRRRRWRRAVRGASLPCRGGHRVRVAAPTDHRRQVRTVDHGVFARPTGLVLMADDGYDGVTLVDLDHRIAVRRPFHGQGAGDQPFRLTRTGDAFIVGWDPVWAVPLDGSASRLLGEGAVSVPAVEPGTVWLYDYKTMTRAWQVDLFGRTLHEVPLGGAFPWTGVAGGLVVGHADTMTIIDADGRNPTVGHRRHLRPHPRRRPRPRRPVGGPR